MTRMQCNAGVARATARLDLSHGSRLVSASSGGSALNTILAEREHAPAEIAELESEIHQLHHRLAPAHARKHLLEELLSVIEEADAVHLIAR